MQVAGLTALRHLSIEDAPASLELSLLARLPQLARLSLARCQQLPGSLALPASLRALRLSSIGANLQLVQRSLHSALQGATQLTYLLLDNVTLSSLPAALGSLLEHFDWDASTASQLGLAALPSGPYLRSLTWLAVPAPALTPTVLAARPQLECLGLSLFGSLDSAQQVSMLRWAAEHPGLRHVSLGSTTDWLQAPTAFALLEAGRRAPHL